CEFIPRLDLKTRVTLVVHAKELKRTTNTGSLALEALSNSQLIVRGKTKDPVDLTPLLSPEYLPLLFFPSEDAIELTEEFVKSSALPIHLIVPDGNWRQASKVHHRHSELGNVQRVMIKTPNTASQHLRAETTPEGMATLQAIALALGIIEGTNVGNSLMALYDLKLNATLQGRGTKLPKTPCFV
ncbi:MAG: tRNA-uridine aminocarboxypropyltransferase, partial [Bdellovibrionota bacterium]